MSALKKHIGEYFIVILTVLIGLSATLGLSYAQYRAAHYEQEEAFKIAANDRIHVITSALKDTISVNESVAAFFHASSDVSRTEFRIFTSQLLKNYPYIEAFEWMPVVPAAERGTYETRGRQDVPGYQFLDFTPNGELVPAATKESYYPILYVEPVTAETRRVFGVDFMSHDIRRQTMQQALASRTTTASAKVSLLTSNRGGILFFSPVIMQGSVKGFITAAVPLHLVIAQAVEELNKEGVNIIIHDITAQDAPQPPLFIFPSRLHYASDEEVLSIYNSRTMRVSAAIDVAARKWSLTIVPSKGFFQARGERAPYAALAAGILFTAMLAYYMLGRIRENVRISNEVEVRTKEVEMILHSTREGIIGIDSRGIIEFANETAESTLGYGRHEMLGGNFYALVQHSTADGRPYEESSCPIGMILAVGGDARDISSEVFWTKQQSSVQVEYTASAMLLNDKVTGAVIIFRDITERKRQQQQLEHMARFDPLTGLANRRLFLELVRKTLSRADRVKGNVALLYLDLNDFKPVNDTLGHAAGDMLLKQFSERISGVIRDHDSMARLGGDEFAILMDNVQTRSDCEALLSRMRHALTEPFIILGSHVSMSSSIGVALYPENARTIDDLLHAADGAMYEAKRDKTKPYVFSRQTGETAATGS